LSQVATDTPPLFDCRNAFASAIEKLADSDPRIVAVVNDSVGSSKLSGFKARFPDRLINVGIAEQNMVGVGAGLANGGFVPFVSAASCFLTARAMEQVKADIAYSNVNVKLVGQSSGVAYGELGATHHSIEMWPGCGSCRISRYLCRPTRGRPWKPCGQRPPSMDRCSSGSRAPRCPN